MINSFNLDDKSRLLCKSPNERKKKGGQNHCIENKRNIKHDNVADDIRTYCNRVSKKDNVKGLQSKLVWIKEIIMFLTSSIFLFFEETATFQFHGFPNLMQCFMKKVVSRFPNLGFETH